MKLAILGSTGSVGETGLAVAGRLGLEVVALAAGRASSRLAEQARATGASLIVTRDAPDEDFRRLLPGGCRLARGGEGLVEAALAADIALVAVLGIHGLEPTLEALRAGRRVALANKETLVAGGDLVAPLAAGGGLVPVDSEHASFFRLLGGRSAAPDEHLYITGSGGALRAWPLERLAAASPADVLKHPTWRMGPKVTVDSATLMNKGLEMIEAHHLFGASYDRIHVLLHDQSVVHAALERPDGSWLLEAAPTDMALPLARALTWPDLPPAAAGTVDLAEIGQLTFRPVDEVRYPSLPLAGAVGRMGGIFPAVMNAANEEAVTLFLGGRIAFTEIYRLTASTIEAAVGAADLEHEVSLPAVRAADAFGRDRVRQAVDGSRP